LRIIKSIEDAKALIGEEVGLSDWIVIDQHRIDQFAEATTDHQWIHVDTERAASSRQFWTEQGPLLCSDSGRLAAAGQGNGSAGPTKSGCIAADVAGSN